MRKFFHFLATIAVLATSAAIAMHLIDTAPEPKRRPPKPIVPVVEILEVKPSDYQVSIKSQGIISARTQSTLVSEVAGRIVYAAPGFRNGGFFQTNDVLVHIDPAEYRLEVSNIEAGLLGVKARIAELETTEMNLKKSLEIETQHLTLAEKQYRRLTTLRKQGTVAQSALEDSGRERLLRRASLQNLNNSLALIPAQHRTLESELRLKKVQLAGAQLDLNRTQIKAPYDGRVLNKQADLGQSVSKGSTLATIYAVDVVEVRLPITDRDASFLDLPEGRRGEPSAGAGTPVTLFTRMGEKRYQWQGRITHTEGTLDTRTRQIFIIAQIDDPYSPSSGGRPPLRLGQFVEAEIPGRSLPDVIVLPRKAVRANDEVMLVTPDARIQRQRVDVIWRDEKNIVVRSGLKSGDRISLTMLPYAPNGAPVKISGAGPEE